MKSKTPTKAESRWMLTIKQEIGCIACRIDKRGYVPADAHHILSGGKRRGHEFTIPLCLWHHRGQGIFSPRIMEQGFGPSLAHNSKAFHLRYGSDDELLALTKQRVAEHNKNWEHSR